MAMARSFCDDSAMCQVLPVCEWRRVYTY